MTENMQDSNMTGRDPMMELAKVQEEFEKFIYIISHDFQAPLRSIRNFSQIILDKNGGIFDEKCTKYFNYVIQGGSQMQEMVDSLLYFSRLNTRPGTYITAPITVLIQNALELSEIEIANSQSDIHFNQNLDIPLHCNCDHISYLIAVLIKNAVIFQPKGQTAKVEIDAVVEGEHCIISVKDNGLGLEESTFEEIFDVFKCLNNPADYPGVGMGLPIARKIATKHNGRIWLESTPGKGSIFYASIPLQGKNRIQQ